MPPGPGRRDGASEAKATLCLRLAIWLCSVVYDHQESNFGALCRRCFPKGVVDLQDGNDSPIEQYDD